MKLRRTDSPAITPRSRLIWINSPSNPTGATYTADELKALVKGRGLGDRVMVQKTSCLKHCSRGITVAVQPDNVWYAGVRPPDLDEICGRHLERGETVDRLLMPDIPWE